MSFSNFLIFAKNKVANEIMSSDEGYKNFGVFKNRVQWSPMPLVQWKCWKRWIFCHFLPDPGKLREYSKTSFLNTLSELFKGIQIKLNTYMSENGFLPPILMTVFLHQIGRMVFFHLFLITVFLHRVSRGVVHIVAYDTHPKLDEKVRYSCFLRLVSQWIFH